MSEAIKPTPGPWEVHSSNCERWSCYVFPKGNGNWPYDTICHIEEAFGPNYSHPGSHTANARLIAEAGTVHHETGLTPRQLVERVKELEEAAWRLLNALPTAAEMTSFGFDGKSVEGARNARSNAIAALSKALPNTVAETQP